MKFKSKKNIILHYRKNIKKLFVENFFEEIFGKKYNLCIILEIVFQKIIFFVVKK